MFPSRAVRPHHAGATVIVLLALPSAARAQTPIASLPWTSGFSAGPRAQNYPPAQDNMDIWIVEDFQTSRPWLVGGFSCVGSGIGVETDVPAVILDAPPPAGQIVLSSTPGAGNYVQPPPPQWGTYRTTFGNQRLRPGMYWLMWTVNGGSDLVPVMFVQSGPYAAGRGTPNTSYQFNPGGGWAFPEGELDPVTEGFNHTGPPTGVNFTLSGTLAPCPADFDGNGTPEPADVAAFVNLWFASLVAGTFPGDFDNDGTVAPADVAAFVAEWITAATAGC